jgi:phosphoribosyl 1,2-cyclic phosphodiesterase
LRFATLASGSSGNSILVGQGERFFLVDAGLPASRLLDSLASLGISRQQLEGIFITHEHGDHLSGAFALARKCGIPIYATLGIWEEMEKASACPAGEYKKLVDGSLSFTLAGLKVRLCRTSHDSRESFGLRVDSPGCSLGIVTDTGMITPEMDFLLAGLNAYIIEANHDRQKLWDGPYPRHLKQRIDSNRGHLSNRQTGEVLRRWIEPHTQKVVLAHLSEINNTPALALRTVVEMLKNDVVRAKCSALRLRAAPRHEPHELIVLGEEE